MLKLNASYSKKVPAEGEYTSQSYHASIEVELPDGLTPDQLHCKIHETFELVRNSVESELHGGSTPPPPPPQQSGYSRRTGSNSQSDTPASPKQIKFLLDIARNKGITADQLKSKFQVAMLEDLTRSQCSRAIDELNGKAA